MNQNNVIKQINVALASYPEKWLVESNPHPFINPVKKNTGSTAELTWDRNIEGYPEQNYWDIIPHHTGWGPQDSVQLSYFSG